ncbi:PspC domain-containing protein [Candidatus Woesebacteria bacterium]|nr:MAG: PspC domain-containing protein [Candidatus Woesebacteria bacterium]
MTKKRLVRPLKGRMVAGVCLALSDYFNVDPTIVRIFWAFLLIPGGFPGLISYVICWILIPSE